MPVGRHRARDDHRRDTQELETPALLLDEARMSANIRRLRSHLKVILDNVNAAKAVAKSPTRSRPAARGSAA